MTCFVIFKVLVGLAFLQKGSKTAFEGDTEAVDLFLELGMEAVGVEMLRHGSLTLLPN